ncbi:hypothetical protein QJQ45_000017 [Haematococcus lacustris]|nr:hypothetical protein QJQ45_000017 [Haematococcus lacustris]
MAITEWTTVAYTDGSCIKTSEPDPARVGAGVYIPESKALLTIAMNDLENNTINKAELTAIHAALKAGARRIATDSLCSLYQIRRALANPMSLINHRHNDILTDIATLIIDSPDTIQFYKVRAHSGIIGNEGADALAKHAALHPEQANTLGYHPTIPKERGIWLNHGTDSETLAPLPDCRQSVRAHMHSKHKLGLANQDSIYYQMTQDITKAAAKGAGERVMTDATISIPAQRTALLYRTGGLYNQKLAMRWKQATDDRCPLCGEADSATHLLSGCSETLPLVQERHNGAGRLIAKAISKGTLGGCIRFADTGSWEKGARENLDLPNDTLHTTLRALGLKPTATKNTTRPDILMVAPQKKTGKRDKAIKRITIVEIKYCADSRFDVANNQPVICEHYVKVQLRINSFCCMCLLTVMPDLVHAYDVLLGADWLTVQGALVDYVDKTLTLRTPQANPKALVTAKQAARWLRKGGSAMVAMVSLEDLALPVDAVSHVQRQHLQDLLDEYSDVFQPITGLPPERAVGHSIPLQPDGKPPARPSYRMSKPEQDELRKQITDLLAKGLIEPSSSPYAAPVLFVQKKSGELRMCIDYRQLNKITIRDQYPLPRIDDLFDQLAGKTVFSSLDLQAGYHQIRIPAEDVPKTAFRTPMGHYQFKVLCFGLTNAPATFQRVMNEAFAEVINDCALVYLDDILVMSKDSEEHLVHLRRVFDLLRKYKFYAKLSKCEFMQRTLKFLGHIISAHGISVDPCKVTAISEWPVPTSLKTLQSFLGAANYVRKFVHNFSTIAAPLTNLTGPKKESFPWKAWPQAELDAFNALKQAISNVPMLKLPDHSKPFQVHCDASLEGIGAVLMQDGYPLAYYSRKLIPAEINYTTGEQELLALVSACQQWRCYLEGVPFTLSGKLYAS